MIKYITLYNQIICCYRVEIVNNKVTICKVFDINNKLWEGEFKNIFHGKTYNNDLQWKPISYIAFELEEKKYLYVGASMLFFEIDKPYEEINKFIKSIMVIPLLSNSGNQIDDEEENIDINDLSIYNGNNELVKTFNEKYCICLENSSSYIFKNCGHSCVCDSCYHIGVKLTKRVICRS